MDYHPSFLIRSFVRSFVHKLLIFFSFTRIYQTSHLIRSFVRSFVCRYILIVFLFNQQLSLTTSFSFICSLGRPYITHFFYLSRNYPSFPFVHSLGYKLLICFSLTKTSSRFESYLFLYSSIYPYFILTQPLVITICLLSVHSFVRSSIYYWFLVLKQKLSRFASYAFVRTYIRPYICHFFLFNQRLSPFASYPIFRSFVRSYMTHFFVFI